ncbi:MAG: type I DNA topoisomerase [Bernardetiaceae bacterium]|jgi:DNA topoisomerase-1|nr:type I DNA topoisomerase [Bernardetiaceae bacterium]
MAKNLVIVESPAKAKTIEGYLGKDFTVKSSYGHVRDLPKSDNAIDIQNNFQPHYEVSDDKRELVAQLAKLAQQSETIWLATDDDREGEAISWHLREALKLTEANTRRIVFREITKSAILKAIQSPRTLDIDLVNAQQARRILDRLVGFELSPILWKKIKGGLSAGRVQSVAVRLVVEREREIEKFKSTSDYKVNAVFTLDKGKELLAELPKRFATEAQAVDFLKKCLGAQYSIKNLEKKPAKKSPAPPFTTSTLQQEANRKLGYSVSQTMRLAQKLYEAGHISYMRTDSLNLSEEAIAAAAAAIRSNYGEPFLQTRRYKTKNDSAQEAHEAIRPTNFGAANAGEERNEQRLYELIWKRAIASQMADAQLERTIATIAISTTPETLEATGEVIRFEGFLKVYLEDTDDEGEEGEQRGMLPPLNVGQVLPLNYLRATEKFSRPSPRYTEASLVKKLEEMGIGRPSTYAPTIATVQERDYVVKENRDGRERRYQEHTLKNDQITTATKTEITGAEKMKLFPTDLAMVVNDFLVNNFPNIIDYSFTAKVEKEFDEIASGKIAWQKMMGTFYQGFHLQVTDTAAKADRSAGERKLGTDPVSGKEVIARLGRYGPIAQLGSDGQTDKPQYASLRKGQLIETITLAEALELFKLPRELGEFEGKKMVANVGRFGPYVSHASQFYSLPKNLDPYTVSEAEAVGVIEAKRLADKEKVILTFAEAPDVKVLNGRWGPYIAVGKLNVKIPKGKDPAALTLAECLQLAEAQPDDKKAKASQKAEVADKKAAKGKAGGGKTVAAKSETKKLAKAVSPTKKVKGPGQ